MRGIPVFLRWNQNDEKWIMTRQSDGSFLMFIPDCANARAFFGFTTKDLVYQGELAWFDEGSRPIAEVQP